MIDSAARAAAAGDADLAAVGRLLAEPARTRMLLALDDGRALPASMLAAEAGVAPSTASEHLAYLVESGFLRVEPQGRHRYYRLAGPQIGALIEAVAAVAPPQPVRSLRQGTRAAALRAARTCYDHLAGRLGVAIFDSLVRGRYVIGGDGVHHLDGRGRDRLATSGRDLNYQLTARGCDLMEEVGVELPVGSDGAVPLRYCVDWTEQRHHLSGVVGRALAARLFARGWLVRADRSRAVHLTDAGRSGLSRWLGIDTDCF
jgi:DNA-binding transcriptional ArsR family regulator